VHIFCTLLRHNSNYSILDSIDILVTYIFSCIPVRCSEPDDMTRMIRNAVNDPSLSESVYRPYTSDKTDMRESTPNASKPLQARHRHLRRTDGRTDAALSRLSIAITLLTAPCFVICTQRHLTNANELPARMLVFIAMETIEYSCDAADQIFN